MKRWKPTKLSSFIAHDLYLKYVCVLTVRVQLPEIILEHKYYNFGDRVYFLWPLLYRCCINSLTSRRLDVKWTFKEKSILDNIQILLSTPKALRIEDKKKLVVVHIHLISSLDTYTSPGIANRDIVFIQKLAADFVCLCAKLLNRLHSHDPQLTTNLHFLEMKLNLVHRLKWHL